MDHKAVLPTAKPKDEEEVSERLKDRRGHNVYVTFAGGNVHFLDVLQSVSGDMWSSVCKS